MAQRSELHTLLLDLIGNGNVYFQPPPTIEMQYPCIRYSRDDRRTDFANNKPYKHRTRYQVTVIDPNPDSEIPGKVADLPLCVFDRHYTADQLNHDVFNIFF